MNHHIICCYTTYAGQQALLNKPGINQSVSTAIDRKKPSICKLHVSTWLYYSFVSVNCTTDLMVIGINKFACK